MNQTLNRKRKILVIDDMANNLKILENILLKNNYAVFTALDGSSGIEIAKEIKPDLILLDIMMPDIDGYDTCRHIRDEEELRDVPVIFITAKNQQEDVLRAFEVGGNDYVVKPFFFQEVLHRIRVHVENKLLREQLYDMSMKDPLTGLWNRRYFTDQANIEIERSLRYNRKLSFVICDIDDFKKVNDKYGHSVGDMVLKKIAEGLINSVRHSDCVGRWGGEEFVILFPEVTKETTFGFLKRIKNTLSGIATTCAKGEISVSLSFGISGLCDLSEGDDEFDMLYKIADDRLYTAKRSGKNCIIFE